jgi:hypothetical protein
MGKWGSWFGVVVVAASVFSGCGGGDDQSHEIDRLKSQAADAIQRVQDSAAAARASSSSSMVDLEATAGRGADQLRAVQVEIDDLHDSSSGADASHLNELAGDVRDWEAFARALADPKPSIREVELTAARAEQASETTPEFARPDVNALISSLRRTRTRSAKASNGISEPVGSDSESTASALSFFNYTGPAFQARLPTGGGWASPAQSEPTPGRLFRTSVRGPNQLFVIIDYTPSETAKFGGRYQSRTTVGQTAFGSATKYVFQGGRLPECQRSRCVDYIINDNSTGEGFGVLAGGNSFAAASQLAETVAESVTPIGD